MNKQELKDVFLTEVQNYTKGVNMGDHKLVNRTQDKLHSIYNSLREVSASDLFIEFMNNDDENVRLWASLFSLRSSKDLAEKTLEELTKLSTITSLTAKTTLTLWKQGKLDLI